MVRNPRDKEQDDIEVTQMRRSSFIEFLIRLAQNKYMEGQKKVSYAEALEKLLQNFILR